MFPSVDAVAVLTIKAVTTVGEEGDGSLNGDLVDN